MSTDTENTPLLSAGGGGGDSGLQPPSNQDILNVMGSTRAALEKQQTENPQLDSTGKQLAGSAAKLLRTTEDLLQEKNSDEILQKFFRHAIDFGERFKQQGQQAAQQGKQAVQQVAGSQEAQQAVDKAKQATAELAKDAQAAGNEALERLQRVGEQLRNLLRQVVTSGEVRALLLETIDFFDRLLSNVTGDAGITKDDVKKAATKAMDAAAGDESAKHELKEQAQDKAHQVKENVKEKAIDTAEQVSGVSRDEAQRLGGKIKDAAAGDQEAKEHLKDEAQHKGHQLKEQAKEVVDTAKDAADEATSTSKADQKGHEVKEQAKEKGHEVKEQVKEKGHEVKEKAKDAADQATSAGKHDHGKDSDAGKHDHGKDSGAGGKHGGDVEKKRREMAQSFRQLLAKIGRNKQYKQLVKELIGLVEFLREKADEAADKLDEKTRDVRQDLDRLYNEAVAVLGQFTSDVGQTDGGERLDRLQNQFFEFYRRLYADDEIRGYFEDLKKWAYEALDHPQRMLDKATGDASTEDVEKAAKEAQKLVERGTELLKDEAQRGEARRLFEEVRQTLQRLQNNRYVAAYSDALSEGSQAFSGSMLQALAQTRLLVAPVLKSLLVAIKLPRLVGRSADTSYALDNMTVSGRELALDDVHFKLKFGMKQALQLVIILRDLEAAVRDGSFAYFSVGFFTDYQDEGKFSAYLAASKWKLKWIIDQPVASRPPRLRLATVSAPVDKLTVQVDEARHKVIDKVALSLFSGELKRATSESVEGSLRHYAEMLTQKFNEFFLQKKFYAGDRPASGPPDEGYSTTVTTDSSGAVRVKSSANDPAAAARAAPSSGSGSLLV